MQVNHSGTAYEVYVQNDSLYSKESEVCKNSQYGFAVASEDYVKEFNDFCDALMKEILELKGASAGEVLFNILPTSLNNTTKTILGDGVDKMQNNGESDNILKSVIGVVKSHYTSSGDETQKGGMLEVKNERFTNEYDVSSIQKTIAKFQELYGTTSDISQGLGRFSNIIDYSFGELKYNESHYEQTQNSYSFRQLVAETEGGTLFAHQDLSQTSTESVLKKLLQTKYDTVLNMKDGTTDKSVDSKA